MKNRIATIVNDLNQNKDNIYSLVEQLVKCQKFDKVIVFTKFDIDNQNGIDIYRIPEEKDTRPKTKNYVTNEIKKLYPNSMLHLLEDCIEIKKDPSDFITDIENIMDKLDMNSYFGTITDACNYVYSKYNPRLNISIDNEKYSNLRIKNILFCSHSNVQWIIFNLSKATDIELFFDESYCIDMFWIIQYLAQRRNVFSQSMYFMNQYVTCESEYGVYSRINGIESEQDNLQQKMAEEDQLFKSKNIDFSPTNNIDMLLERLYNKLNSKI